MQAAESIGHPNHAIGENLLVGPTQIDQTGEAGSPLHQSVQVTNVGSSAQTVTGKVRQLTNQLSNQTGTVTLSAASPTFVDQFGNSVPYQQIQFHRARRAPTGSTPISPGTARRLGSG